MGVIFTSEGDYIYTSGGDSIYCRSGLLLLWTNDIGPGDSIYCRSHSNTFITM